MKHQTLTKPGIDTAKIATLLNMAYLHVDCADAFITDLKTELKRNGQYRLNVKHDVNRIKSMINEFLGELKFSFSTGEQEGFGDVADFLRFITTKILLAIKSEEDMKWFEQQIDKMITERKEFDSKLDKLKKQKINLNFYVLRFLRK